MTWWRWREATIFNKLFDLKEIIQDFRNLYVVLYVGVIELNYVCNYNKKRTHSTEWVEHLV